MAPPSNGSDHDPGPEGAPVGALDVGTNSVLLLVANARPGRIDRVLFDAERNPRLGEGLGADRLLQEPAMRRAAQAIDELLRSASLEDGSSIRAAGTSALRDAANRQDFLRLVKSRSDVEITVITGDLEAQLTFAGVTADPDVAAAHPDEAKALIVVADVGGGSTELMWGGAGKLEQATSVDIGSSRLLRQLPSVDPPPAGARDRLVEAASAALAPVTQRLPVDRERILVFAGGTAKTLADIERTSTEQSDTGDIIERDRLERRVAWLASSSRDQRLSLPNMPKERVDTIVTGAAILLSLLTLARAERAVVSRRGLRYGVAMRETWP